jgi:hypothetical protein
MSNYDEIENIHSYHGTREKLGVDVSGVEIDHSKAVEYCQVRVSGELRDVAMEGWEVTASWREGVETVYGMRREVKANGTA